MKTPQEQTIIVLTTPRQRKVIEELQKKHLEDGGSLLAQAFKDGLRIRVLTPAQTAELSEAISKALGAPAMRILGHSAFDLGGDAK